MSIHPGARPILIFLLVATSLPAFAEWISASDNAMGTAVSVTLWHENKLQGEGAAKAVLKEMHRVDQAFSPWIETSQLARLNKHAANFPVNITREMEIMIDKALWVSERSEGAFDITFASVGWYYDYRKKIQPSEEKRQKLLPAVNYRYLNVQKHNQTTTLAYGHPNVRMDLGGIAKGYAVDRAIDILKSKGVRHATVSAGGDSRVLGDKRGQAWVIGIKNPRASPGDKAEPIIYLPLENTAVSTSGDYERFFMDEDNGERIHHIINPKTGKSAQGVISVTILADRGLDSDPLSTAVFVLGVEKGLNLVNRLQGVDCIVIDSSGKVHYSAGLSPPT